MFCFGVVLYGVLVLLFGLRHRDAGRRPSFFAQTASLCAAFIGGGFCLGNAAAGFSDGLRSSAMLCGFSLGQVISALFLVPRLSRVRGVRTAGELIARAFGPTAGRFCGMLATLFCTGVLGAQISAFGAVAGDLFGADSRLCAAAGFGLLILFAVLGGEEAAMGSDTLQIAVLFAGIPLTLLFSLRLEAVTTARLAQAFLLLPDRIRDGGPVSFFAGFLTYLLGELLCPPTVQRTLALPGSSARRATLASALLSVPFFFCTGLCGFAARLAGLTDDPQRAMPSLIRAALPFPLSVAVTAAMLFVYLSAGGAFLSGCSAALTHNVVAKPLSAGCRRGYTVLCGAAALVLALAFDGVLSILIISYCFWCPLVPVPLMLACGGRRYAPGVFTGPALSTLLFIPFWRALGPPWGIGPVPAGLVFNIFATAVAIRLKKRK